MHQIDEPRISATFKFYPNGKLKAVFLNVENDTDQETLERALENLFKTDRYQWLRKLMRRCRA